jgi:signal transduction histidine kinase
MSVDTWHGAVRSGQPFQIEHRFWDKKSSTYRWHLGRALPVRDAEGNIVRWFGTCTDVDDLRRAQEALQDADRRKDEFLAMLAHELRNPLAPIRNALHIMHMRGVDSAVVAQARTVMERQLEHLVRIVDDLLDVSRIMRGKIAIQRQPVAIATVVERAVETAHPVMDAQGHQLEITLPAEPLWVSGDVVRLTQVVANLLSNAAKYTERAGRVWLTVERHGGDVLVQVRDSGVGIAADLLPHVFDLFMQAGRSIDRAQGGLGIGLTLCKKLVEMHGGTIAAHSDGPGSGAEFTVRLPVLVTPGAPRRAARRNDRCSCPPPRAGGGRQRRCGRQSRHAPATLGPAGGDCARWPGSAGNGRPVPARSDLAGHRPAEPEWLRSGTEAPPAA